MFFICDTEHVVPESFDIRRVSAHQNWRQQVRENPGSVTGLQPSMRVDAIYARNLIRVTDADDTFVGADFDYQLMRPIDRQK